MKMKNQANRAARWAARAERKLAKAEAKLVKAEAKVVARRAKVEAVKGLVGASGETDSPPASDWAKFKLAKAEADRNDKARIALIPDCGHSIMSESPDGVLFELKQFIGENHA